MNYFRAMFCVVRHSNESPIDHVSFNTWHLTVLYSWVFPLFLLYFLDQNILPLNLFIMYDSKLMIPSFLSGLKSLYAYHCTYDTARIAFAGEYLLYYISSDLKVHVSKCSQSMAQYVDQSRRYFSDK